MSEKEQWISLDQAATFSSGGTPSKANSDYWDGEIPWVSAKDMKTSRIFDVEDHISEAGLANGSSLAPAGATLVLVRGMTLLNDVPICLATRDVAFNQDVKALVPRDGVVGTYLHYAIHATKPTLLSAVDLAGHGTEKLPTDIFKSVQIRLPQEDEQRAVAHILGTLDDKIEVNRRMNETLEAMARAIFKSWFVDFDPVRAKASGEPEESICQRLGLTPEVLALFPACFEDSETGQLPKNWAFGTVRDVALQVKRGVDPKQIVAKTPYIGLEHMPRRSIALLDWGVSDSLESNKFRFRRGEILFGKLRPYFHKVGVAPIDGVCSTDIVVIAPNAASWFGYLLGHLSSDAFVSHTSAGSTGTKMPRTNWIEMAKYSIVMPPERTAAAFDKVVRPLIDRMIATAYESQSLMSTRDLLLPKLLSGRLTTSKSATDVEYSLA